MIAGLVYLQFRNWSQFNWAAFFATVREVLWGHIVAATAIIYSVYWIRALRWALLLRSSRQVPAGRLVTPTIVGFTAVALLGRAGEVVRPYLIAHRERLSLSSQMAIWTVERILDLGSFTVIVGLSLLMAKQTQQLSYFARLRQFGWLLAVALVLVSLCLLLVQRHTKAVAELVERALAKVSPAGARQVTPRIAAFGAGLGVFSGKRILALTSMLSLLIWLLIAAAYWQIMRAYPEPLRSLPLAYILLVLGCGIAGSSVQLPMVGGGAQLATIAALVHIFRVPHELAVSSGLMIWLVTFLAVAPCGLWLAHRDRLSFTRLSDRVERAAPAAAHSTESP